MQPKLAITARVPADQVDAAIVAARPEFSGRSLGGDPADVVFSKRDWDRDLLRSDHHVLSLSVRLEDAGVTFDIHQVATSE